MQNAQRPAPCGASSSPGRGFGGAGWSLLRLLLTGLITGLISVIASVSLAALVFSGPLAAHMAEGISMALVAAFVSGAIIVFSSSSPRVVAIPQDRIAPLLAVMASLVVAGMPSGASADSLLSTVAILVVLTTLVTGLFLVALGFFRFGGLIRFLPFSVIGGFLAGTGWLLLLGALRVLTDCPWVSCDRRASCCSRTR